MTPPRLLGLLVIAGLPLAACGHHQPVLVGSNPGSVSHGVPSGQVLAHGTIDGTFRIVGGPYPGINHPLRGRIELHRGTAAGQVVAIAAVPSDGRFSVDVVPGRYVLVGLTPQVNGGSGGCQGTHPVLVKAGMTTRTTVICAVP